ncbi:MAG: hypothetical protein E7200_00350 [Selenomonas ruminantium]|nr:hypothetical protein [Selenomonas ruminantium]
MRKRLGLFVIFDKDSIIDEYVYVLGKSLREILTEFIIVADCPLRAADRQRLGAFADCLVERNNRGFDAGAIKDVLENHIGFTRMREFEELLIVNDSIFGPLLPLQDVFASMEKSDADFWSLTRNTGAFSIPEHLQSYFIVIRRRLLRSLEFENFWRNMPYYDTFGEVLTGYEFKFLAHFTSLGFKGTAYADTGALAGKIWSMTANPYYQFLDEIVRDQHFPFVKKKPFAFDGDDLRLDSFSRQSFRHALTYLWEQDYYDTGLVWDNILRCFDIEDIQRSTGLHWILPGQLAQAKERYNVAVLWKVSSMEFIPEIIAHIERIKPEVRVLVFATDGKIAQGFSQEFSSSKWKSCHMIKGSASDWYSVWRRVLPILSERYVCCLTDTDFVLPEMDFANRKSAFWNVVDNLSSNPAYIGGIEDLFRGKERLAALLPPNMSSGAFLGDEWRQSKFLGSHGSFVTRCSLLREFLVQGQRIRLDVEASDNSFLRGFVHYAANRGLYSGVVECAESATVELENLRFLLHDFLELMQGEEVIKNRMDVKRILRQHFSQGQAIRRFAAEHKRIFVYGTGLVAQQHVPLDLQPEAFVVSDGQPKSDSFRGWPIRSFSEVRWKSGDGVIIAMSRRNSAQVIKSLRGLRLDYLEIRE